MYTLSKDGVYIVAVIFKKKKGYDPTTITVVGLRYYATLAAELDSPCNISVNSSYSCVNEMNGVAPEL